MNPAKRKRIASIDLLRGVVIVLMTLDHTRWFFHFDAALHNPLDLDTTTPLLFLTRWVTHFCAPVFIFLTGISAFLFKEKRGKKSVIYFLRTRGLWLILLELTLFRFGWDYHMLRPGFDLLIIWVIGITMVVFSFVLWLPEKWLLPLGLFILFAHNLLQNMVVPPESALYLPWLFIYKGGVFHLPGSQPVLVLYSLLPYVGMICLGYATGNLYRVGFSEKVRSKYMLLFALSTILLFVGLRWPNLYGDPSPWSVQKDGLFTLFSFINTTKYPTSLLYALMTLGPALACLALTENSHNIISSILRSFGAVPMFFFIIHLFLLQAMSLLGGSLFKGAFAIQQFGLLGTYLAWGIACIILYPLCNVYGKYKKAHPEKRWLSYL